MFEVSEVILPPVSRSWSETWPFSPTPCTCNIYTAASVEKKKTHTHTNQGCCVVCCWPEALFSYLRIKPRDLSDVPMCCFHKLPAQPPEDSPLAPQPPAVDQTHRTSAHRDQWLQIRRARFTVWSSFKTLQTFLTHCWCFKTSFESWLSYMVQISLKKTNKKKANSALDRF